MGLQQNSPASLPSAGRRRVPRLLEEALPRDEALAPAPWPLPSPSPPATPPPAEAAAQAASRPRTATTTAPCTTVRRCSRRSGRSSAHQQRPGSHDGCFEGPADAHDRAKVAPAKVGRPHERIRADESADAEACQRRVEQRHVALHKDEHGHGHRRECANADDHRPDMVALRQEAPEEARQHAEETIDAEAQRRRLRRVALVDEHGHQRRGHAVGRQARRRQCKTSIHMTGVRIASDRV